MFCFSEGVTPGNIAGVSIFSFLVRASLQITAGVSVFSEGVTPSDTLTKKHPHKNTPSDTLTKNNNSKSSDQ